ncbi:MAG TPA: CHAD domain-containing protein [Lamprocystis sp. (in: g-proteobacteria)]|nr:CHAD domain-containing protein [Lamprocystis sp. (in: g-proteobacteria)]
MEIEYWVSDLPLPITIPAGSAGSAGSWRLADAPVEPLRRLYVDTFDWAIYLVGATLEWRRTAGHSMLIWSGLDQPAETLVQAISAAPAFPTDLPPGPLRTRLLKTVSCRRLLPMMWIDTDRRRLSLRDADDRQVARLTLDESRFQDPRGGQEGDLLPRLRIRPKRGQEDLVAATLTACQGERGLRPATTPILLEALTAVGRRPADYSSKLDFRLDPLARADQVTKEILLRLLATLEANLDGARANLDTEFLHDLRVATRRTRSALGQIRGVFPAAELAHFKDGFAWLQQVTGPVRDLDVYLLQFDAYEQSLPASLRPHLEPLRVFLSSRYAAEQGRLADALGAARFAQLMADWRVFLTASAAPLAPTPNGARPIKEVVDDRIRALVKRVRREGRAIRSDSRPEDLHELRKSCKKLRYLMEFFQSLYSKDDIRGLISLMKALLDNLGDYQDLAVQAAHLRDWAQQMRDEHAAQTDTLLAVGALIGNLLARRERARAAFDEVFSGFSSAENQLAFRTVFALVPA